MAVYTYTTSNIAFSSFDTWSNSIASDSNVSLATVLNDAYPAATADYKVSELYNRSWFYGNIVAGSNGQVSVTYPYASDASTGTIAVKNVDYSVYNYITFTAIPTYPATMNSWRTAANGGGSSITTSTTLTIYVGDYTTQTNFYAHFNA